MAVVVTKAEGLELRTTAEGGGQGGMVVVGPLECRAKDRPRVPKNMRCGPYFMGHEQKDLKAHFFFSKFDTKIKVAKSVAIFCVVYFATKKQYLFGGIFLGNGNFIIKKLYLFKD